MSEQMCSSSLSEEELLRYTLYLHTAYYTSCTSVQELVLPIMTHEHRCTRTSPGPHLELIFCKFSALEVAARVSIVEELQSLFCFSPILTTYQPSWLLDGMSGHPGDGTLLQICGEFHLISPRVDVECRCVGTLGGRLQPPSGDDIHRGPARAERY